MTDVGFYFYGVVAPDTDLAGLRGLDDVEDLEPSPFSVAGGARPS